MQKILKNLIPIINPSKRILTSITHSEYTILKKSQKIRLYYNFEQYYSFQAIPGNFPALNTKMTEIVNNRITETKELIPFLESLEKFGGFFKLANSPLPFNEHLMFNFFDHTINAMSKFENPSDLYISAKVILHLAQKNNDILTKLIKLLSNSDLLFGIKKSKVTELLSVIHQFDKSIIKVFYSNFLVLLKKYSADMTLSSLIYFLGFAHNFLDSIGISEDQHKIFVDIMEANATDIPSIIKTLDSDNLVRLLILSYNFLQTNKESTIKTTIDFIARYYESIHINQTVALLEILTAMKYDDEDLWYHLAESIIVKIHSLNSIQLIKVINCYSHMGYSYNILLEEVVDKLTLRIDDIGPKEIPFLAHSISLTRTKADHLIEALHPKIKANLSSYSVNEIVMLFSAVSTLNSTNKELCNDIEEVLYSRVNEIQFENLEALINGLIFFYRYDSVVFKTVADLLDVELKKKVYNTAIDDVVMAAMFGVTKDIKFLALILDEMVEYCKVRLDNIGIEDINFVLNLGGMLGMYKKGLKENEKLRELGKVYLEKATDYRDLHRPKLKSDFLSALQSMIFAIKNEVNISTK